MPDITLQINSPILTGSEKFKVRYRLLPNGVFSAYQDETNAPFTLTGLDAGQYEVEIIFVRESGEECPPTFVYPEVGANYSCPEFTAQIVRDGGLFYVEISYPFPLTNPPCGWSIRVYGRTQTITPYSVLPTPPIRILAQNVTTDVEVTANLCNGRTKICFGEVIEPISVPCEPIEITDVRLERNPPPSTSWTLTVVYTQSTPATRNGLIVFNQTGVPINAGQILDSGVWQPVGVGGAGSTNRIYAGTVQPIETWGGYTYTGKFVDDCEQEHPFSVHAE